MKTPKVLGYLLSYPENDYKTTLSKCLSIFESEAVLSKGCIQSIQNLVQWMEEQPILDLQEEYVDLFDRTPSLSLHLFEHVHGDSRDRGQAMVDLVDLYKQADLVIFVDEMPDYLPLFLEYLSTQPVETVQGNLASTVNILGALSERLHGRKSLYAGIFDALIEISGCKPDRLSVQREMKKSDGAPRNNEEIDKEWAEQFAFENTPQTTGLFQKNNNACPIAQQMLDRMQIGRRSNGEV